MNEHHYFAATAFGWAVGDTRVQAIREVLRFVDTRTLKQQHDLHGGLMATVCKVDLPITTTYTIVDYQPGKRLDDNAPVPKTVEQVRITSKNGDTIPYHD